MEISRTSSIERLPNYVPQGIYRSLLAASLRVEACAVCRTDLHVPYRILWEERQLLSVANFTREDARSFLPVAKAADLATHTVRYRLDQANEAVADLCEGRLQGAAVLVN